ncbi:MAG: hypothetical protein ACRYE9_04715 [Janthinobacterium lividum]
MNILSSTTKVIIYCLILSSCGFVPILSNDFPDRESLGAIEVTPINSIEGAELRHHLVALLPKSDVIRYKLDIQITSSIMPNIIQKNSDIIRENINQIVSYSLIDISSGITLTTNQFAQTSSYNSIYNPYGSSVEQEFTRINLAKCGAEEIRRRLILHFGKVKATVNQ